MESKILSLICPNCGSADQIIDKDLPFGFEFTCKHCGSNSVLIFNDHLYIPAPGDHICKVCGRVAAKNARFCQCGEPLIRICQNAKCGKEFPIGHTVCDFCGTKQISLATHFQGSRSEFVAALHKITEFENRVDFSLGQFTNPNFQIREQSLNYINNSIALCKEKDEVKYLISKLEEFANLSNSLSTTQLIIKAKAKLLNLGLATV